MDSRESNYSNEEFHNLNQFRAFNKLDKAGLEERFARFLIPNSEINVGTVIYWTFIYPTVDPWFNTGNIPEEYSRIILKGLGEMRDKFDKRNLLNLKKPDLDLLYDTFGRLINNLIDFLEYIGRSEIQSSHSIVLANKIIYRAMSRGAGGK